MSKVLFVINTLGCGGAERALMDLLEQFDPKKDQVSLYVLTGQGELVHQLPKWVQLLNPSFSDTSVLTKKGRRRLTGLILRYGLLKGIFFRRLAYLCQGLSQMLRSRRLQPDKLLWRVLSDGAPVFSETYDMAVAFLEGGATYYVADHVKARKKAAFVHIDYSRAGYTRELDLDCYRKMDYIFTISNEVKQHFLAAYPEYEKKVSVFHNVVNQKRICQLALCPGGFDDSFCGVRILSMGRLTEQKRCDVSIAAMALLKQKSPVPLRWYILGEGPLRRQLEAQIRGAGLAQDVILLGVKENPYPYLKQCQLYVHATGYEGKSIAIQEAQTLGKPILATDCSGNREQISHGVDGRMCPLDPDSLCQEILWMLQHPEECSAYGSQAAKRQVLFAEEISDFFSKILP